MRYKISFFPDSPDEVVEGAINEDARRGYELVSIQWLADGGCKVVMGTTD